MRKQLQSLLSILIIVIALSSCKDKEVDELTNPDNSISQPNFWVQKKGIRPEFGRQYAIGFAIGNKGYVGLGESVSTLYKDFWEYDPKTNVWTQKADFGGAARERAVAFTIASKAYVGTGMDENNRLKDFWEFDPVGNIWTRKADFGGTERLDAVAFSIGNKGYVGCGDAYPVNVATKDFWSYDPTTDKWVQKADFGGNGRYAAVGFSIGTKGYIGTGYSYYQWKNEQDFWEYDQAANTWLKKSDFPGAGREHAVAFVIDNKGYLGTGYVPGIGGSSYEGNKDFWKYDPSSNTWVQVADFFSGKKTDLETEDGSRTEAVAFTIGSKGYVGTGQGNMHSRSDFWEYTP